MKFKSIDDALVHACDYITAKDVEIARTFVGMRECGLVPPDSLRIFTAAWWAADVLGLRESTQQQLEFGRTFGRLARGFFGPKVNSVPLDMIMIVAAETVIRWPAVCASRNRVPSRIKCPGKQVAALN